jgi:hypothetical protein
MHIEEDIIIEGRFEVKIAVMYGIHCVALGPEQISNLSALPAIGMAIKTAIASPPAYWLMKVAT